MKTVLDLDNTAARDYFLKANSYCSIGVGMLSDLFTFLKPNIVSKYISQITSRFDKEPFSEYLEIWLQRTSILDDRTRAYDCLLCQKIYQPVNIWNSTWMQNPIDESSIIDENIIADLPARISKNEVDKFNEYDNCFSIMN